MNNLHLKNSKHPNLDILSTSEIAILKLIKTGYTSPQIAKFRTCSSRTVEKHRSNIIKKLKIPSSQNALLVWISNNHILF